MYLAQNLKYLRKQRFMNQNELADILGVKQSTIGNWEADRREPELSTLIHVAEYFGVSLDDLVLKDLRPPVPLYVLNLRFLLEKRKMTQEDIGTLLNVTQKRVSEYEEGKRPLEIENLVKIADYFWLTLDQMVKKDLSKEDLSEEEDL